MLYATNRELYDNFAWGSLIDGVWENGPTLSEVQIFYNEHSNSEYIHSLDSYIEWRMQYEFEQELRRGGIDLDTFYDNFKNFKNTCTDNCRDTAR